MRERRAQVVRDAGEEGRALALDLLEPLEHPVHGACDGDDLFGTGLRHARRRIDHADRIGRARDRRERPVEPPDDEERREQRDGEHRAGTEQQRGRRQCFDVAAIFPHF